MNHYPQNENATPRERFDRSSSQEAFFCGRDDLFASPLPLAMAYVPWQTDGETYSYETGLKKGTVFPCLNKPFLGAAGGCT